MREQKMLTQLDAAVKLVKKIPPTEKKEFNISSQRVNELSKMIDMANESLASLINLQSIDAGLFEELNLMD
jgi:hypothetical protein